MDRIHGFSLTEVLVSLFLVTSTSLALMTQQWQITRLFNQLQLRNHAGIELDSASEMALLERSLQSNYSFYQLSYVQQQKQAVLQIGWEASKDKQSDKQTITRTLIVQ